MTELNNLFPSKEIQSTFVQIQDEVEKVEGMLVELQQKKREVLHNQLNVCSFNLTTLATNINTLSNQLECELSNFKQYISEFEGIYHTIQSTPALINQASNQKSRDLFLIDSKVWKFLPVNLSVPIVVQQESQFLLTAKSVDL
jgi:hypothetical protein